MKQPIHKMLPSLKSLVSVMGHESRWVSLYIEVVYNGKRITWNHDYIQSALGSWTLHPFSQPVTKLARKLQRVKEYDSMINECDVRLTFLRASNAHVGTFEKVDARFANHPDHTVFRFTSHCPDEDALLKPETFEHVCHEIYKTCES